MDFEKKNILKSFISFMVNILKIEKEYYILNHNNFLKIFNLSIILKMFNTIFQLHKYF